MLECCPSGGNGRSVNEVDLVRKKEGQLGITVNLVDSWEEIKFLWMIQ